MKDFVPRLRALTFAVVMARDACSEMARLGIFNQVEGYPFTIEKLRTSEGYFSVSHGTAAASGAFTPNSWKWNDISS